MKNENVKEYGSLVYVGPDGKVHHSDPIEGDYKSISQEAIRKWMSDNSVAMSQVVAFVHNHPSWYYGSTTESAKVNRYPSSNDWNTAQWMVAGGAGGQGGGNFAMYVIDTNGVMREFKFDDKATYEGLDKGDKENGKDLPKKLESDGTSC
jgi:hypothetical protein